MLHKTRGIVFKTTDYSESSVIVQVFTEKFGLQSYLINGVKKPKAKIKRNVLQPLHLLEMVVYHKSAGNIQRVSELRNIPVFQSIPFSIIKSSLTLFLNEVLYRSVRHQGPDEQLFDFLFNGLILLDKTEEGLQVFHLQFLLKLTKHLGFYPDKAAEAKPFFDLKEGLFTEVLTADALVIRPPETEFWASLLHAGFGNTSLRIPAAVRHSLINHLLNYYRYHIEDFGEIKSLPILEELLH